MHQGLWHLCHQRQPIAEEQPGHIAERPSLHRPLITLLLLLLPLLLHACCWVLRWQEDGL